MKNDILYIRNILQIIMLTGDASILNREDSDLRRTDMLAASAALLLNAVLFLAAPVLLERYIYFIPKIIASRFFMLTAGLSGIFAAGTAVLYIVMLTKKIDRL